MAACHADILFGFLILLNLVMALGGVVGAYLTVPAFGQGQRLLGGCGGGSTGLAFDLAGLIVAVPKLAMQCVTGYIMLIAGSLLRTLVLIYQSIMTTKLIEAFTFGIDSMVADGFSPDIINNFVLALSYTGAMVVASLKLEDASYQLQVTKPNGLQLQ